jgi:hypothetical protein
MGAIPRVQEEASMKASEEQAKIYFRNVRAQLSYAFMAYEKTV